MGRVVIGHREGNAPVRRLYVKLFTIPPIAGQLDVHPAIHCSTTHAATDSPQSDSTVRSLKVDLSIDLGDRNAAVVRFQRKVGSGAEQKFRN